MRSATVMAFMCAWAGVDCMAPEPARIAAAPPPPALPSAPHMEEVATPEPTPPPPPVVRRPGAYANLDPDDDYVVGPPEPVADCEEQLTRAGIKFQRASIPLHTEGKAKHTCGAAQVVMYLRGPAKIAYEPAPVVTCNMALALGSWEKIVAEEATRIFHSRIVKIEQLGTYNCRVIPSAPDQMSEHGYANAIDIGLMTLATGRTISIFRDFDRGEAEPKAPAGAFLRAISRRANDEDVFSHVLTPFFDRAHDNHFHLDLARFRHDGTRPGI